MQFNSTIARSEESVLQTNKVIRNTYILLSMTLVFSAVTAFLGVISGIGFGMALGADIVAIVMLWFVLPRTANSASGIPTIFAITGLLGFGLGPLLSHYLSVNPSIVMTALGGTGAIFLALSGYALTTRRDFSFMGGFLMTGILVAFLAGLGAIFFEMPNLSLAVSSMFVLLMAGLILYETSNIIHGGETNYIMATVTLYVAIYNLFASLLHLLGFLGEES